MWGLFSIPKLLFLAAIIGGVWMAFRMLDRRQKSMRDTSSNSKTRRPKAKPLDMVSCSSCGAWVSMPCERPDCPIE
jgi:hypothetical protein